ncbi:hypothetical protein JOF29_002864 [Kribbella aluminosa]|uniref:Uncharacterized protein n=1 Tax=Kribbella aluminosa TaxID=416017 RepID=A0ABS4UJF8_9ACTN|nr:hypothetical protein [Kribbella aluminosa]MBP2351781.1 hypothetical protein [Kribbella aluminosa]
MNRDDLSGFVEPMNDPDFVPSTRGAGCTWTVVDNTSTTTMNVFGKDPVAAHRVIDSLQLARR